MARAEIKLVDGVDSKVRRFVDTFDTASDAAEWIAVVARDLAPVGDPDIDDESGSYRDSIRAEKMPWGARVVADDYKAQWIEFGAPGRNQPARWILHGAAEMLGFQFQKKRGQ